MHVARREQFFLSRCDPAITCCNLTLWAVTIAAAVVRDGGTMPVAGALVEMTAECSGTTVRNGQQHLAVLPAEPPAGLFEKKASPGVKKIGHPPKGDAP